jgi:hypothetical protein
MSSPVIGFLIPIAILAVVLFFVLVQRRKERERTEALSRVAETMGLLFEAEGDVGALRARGDLQIFGRGRDKQAKNVMSGRVSDEDLLVFDYQYTTGSGKHQHTSRETVVVLPAKRSLPDMQMAPENPFTRLAEHFGYQDIDIESSPEFSRRYIVKGSDEAAIRAALYPSAVSYFADHEGWTVEVLSGRVAVYRDGRRAKPEDLRTFIEDARAAVRSL